MLPSDTINGAKLERLEETLFVSTRNDFASEF